jgi:polysaccharide biosynthesis protein PslH
MSPTPPLHVLQLAPRYSGRPTGGAELRNFYLAQGLARQMRVTHVGFAADAVPAPDSDSQPRFLGVSRRAANRLPDLALGVLGTVPFPVLNYTRPEMAAALRDLFARQRFDIVLQESIHMAGYLPLLRSLPNPPLVVACDWHNIESELMRRFASSTPSLAKRLYAALTARKLERFERRFMPQCDLHLAVSPRDRERLAQYNPNSEILLIDNGVDSQSFAWNPASQPDRILFVGSMDYHANIEAVVSFARDVWPEIARRLPGLVFTIVGRNPPPQIRQLAEAASVEVTGTVDDVRPYYRQAWISVVPLRIGAGTRLKILESMAAGVPVVSTSLGAEGLRAEPGCDYLLADTAAETVRAIMDLRENPELHASIAHAGRELVQRQYEWSALAAALAARLTAAAEAKRKFVSG